MVRQPARVCTHPWEFAAEAFRIADGLCYVGNASVSSHLIDTGAGLVLIDTTYPQTVYLLLESVRRLGFDPDDIRHILHIHAHYDHCGGTRAIVELTGAETYLGEPDVEIVERFLDQTWAPEYGFGFHEGFRVDHPLHDGDVVRIGEVAFDCVAIPGHTPGSMSFFFEAAEGGRTYRVGIHGGPGLNTLTDEYLTKNNLPFSRRDDYLRSLERLRRENVDVFLGAHPAQNDTLGKRERMTDDENPFIDPSAWGAFLDNLEARARELFAGPGGSA